MNIDWKEIAKALEELHENELLQMNNSLESVWSPEDEESNLNQARMVNAANNIRSIADVLLLIKRDY